MKNHTGAAMLKSVDTEKFDSVKHANHKNAQWTNGLRCRIVIAAAAYKSII